MTRVISELGQPGLRSKTHLKTGGGFKLMSSIPWEYDLFVLIIAAGFFFSCVSNQWAGNQVSAPGDWQGLWGTVFWASGGIPKSSKIFDFFSHLYNIWSQSSNDYNCIMSFFDSKNPVTVVLSYLVWHTTKRKRGCPWQSTATIVNTFPLHDNALWKDMCKKNYGQVSLEEDSRGLIPPWSVNAYYRNNIVF